MIETTIINTALSLNDPARTISIRGYKALTYSETPSQPNFEEVNIQGRSSPIQFYNNGSARTISFSMAFLRDMFQTALTGSEVYIQPTINADVRRKGNTSAVGIYTEDQGLKNMSTSKLQQLAQSELASYYGADTVSELGIYGAGSTDIRSAKASATEQFHQFLNKIRALNYPVYTNNGVISPKCILRIGGGSDSVQIGALNLEGFCKTSIEFDGLEGFNSFIAATVRFEFTEVVHYSWSASQILKGDPAQVFKESHDEWWR